MGRLYPVRDVPVERIRPEDGLGRKRDREGHRELQQSIARFGVLTPITVRPAPDGSGDFLLIKGQGRTLACRLLGIDLIPATVVDASYADDEKVQQFLVENVARLKMRPIDRALLIHRARLEGEETSEIARRFGLSTTTVRRLLAQLQDASVGEVAALGAGGLSLALHAVIARHVAAPNRAEVMKLISTTRIKARELDQLFLALGWRELEQVSEATVGQRLALLGWACAKLDRQASGSVHERFRQLALQFPEALEPIDARPMAEMK